MERDAVRPLVDRGRDVERRRQPGVEDERRDQRRLGRIERGEPNLLGDPLGDQPGPPLTQARAARDVVGAVVAGQQESAVAGPAGELGDDLEAHVVGPLQVLEAEHRRPGQAGKGRFDVSMTSRRRWACSAARTACPRSRSAARGSRRPASGASSGRGRGSTRRARRGLGARRPLRRRRTPRASALRRIAEDRVLPMPA